MRNTFIFLAMTLAAGCAKERAPAAVPQPDSGMRSVSLAGHLIQVPERWGDSKTDGAEPCTHPFYDTVEDGNTGGAGQYDITLYRTAEPLAFLALETQRFTQVMAVMDVGKTDPNALPYTVLFEPAEGITVIRTVDPKFGKSFTGFRAILLPECGQTLFVTGTWVKLGDAARDLRRIKPLSAAAASPTN